MTLPDKSIGADAPDVDAAEHMQPAQRSEHFTHSTRVDDLILFAKTLAERERMAHESRLCRSMPRISLHKGCACGPLIATPRYPSPVKCWHRTAASSCSDSEW